MSAKQEVVEVWSQYDHIVYILSGKKTWSTRDESWTVNPGESLYIKKGATIIKQIFEEDFCMLGFFITDDVIRSSLRETIQKIAIKDVEGTHAFVIDRISIDNQMESFFQSVLGYFHDEHRPLESILELKTKELLLNIVNNRDNQKIANYLKHITLNKLPSLPFIMEANYRYNLSLEQFADLCNRSKSSFKRDFKNHFNTSPGKWLLEKRLIHAQKLLKTDFDNISQVAYECGFESPAHFSRTFKIRFGTAPSTYKNNFS